MVMLAKDRLKLARENAGFKTPTAAARAFKNMNVNTLISNENGNRDISRKMAVLYGNAFGVSPGWILYGEDFVDSPPALKNVPLISWVSAGAAEFQEGIDDFSDFPTITAYDLPKGEWIALHVDGQSMNKISPHNSIILVNIEDKELVPNAYYIVMDETGQATYKRYRPGERPPFQPFSTQDIAPPKLQGEIRIIGRVRRTITDM